MKNKINFKEGKIIEIFYAEKNGKKIPVIIRYPKKSDVKEIWKFYNKVIKETDFLARMTSISMKDERKWILDTVSSMRKNNKVQIFAESNGRIIGSASIERKRHQRKNQVGDFGIAILQEFSGLGIGKHMMDNTEKDAKKMKFEMIELGVYGKNKIAQNLYDKMGFKVAGKIPKSVKSRKGYDDDIIMYKVLKK